MPRPSQSTSASCSSPIPSRCSFGDQNPTFSFSFRDSRSRVHVCNAAAVRCDMAEALNFPNGKPNIPVLNERTLPKFLETARMEKTVNRTTNNRIKLFSGTANPALSQEIACYMGVELGKINIKRFADGEIYVQLQESVRGCDVYLVQPTCPLANENLMELLIMIDACRRASAKNITAVIPYFGYARADRKTQGRESIAAKLVANLITEAGADRVLACDLHSGQSMGYFDIPVDHVYCQPVILDYLASKTVSSNDLVVVSPDVGGVARARAFAKKLSDAPLAIVDKRRHGHNVAEVITSFTSSLCLIFILQVMNLIGDVKGKVAVMVDDMIDTAGTIAKGAALLHQEGAREVYACCTHAVFSPPAIERLSGGLFQEVIVTNTIPVAEKNYFPELTVLSIANLLGETIWRVHDDCSIAFASWIRLSILRGGNPEIGHVEWYPESNSFDELKSLTHRPELKTISLTLTPPRKGNANDPPYPLTRDNCHSQSRDSRQTTAPLPSPRVLHLR
ncbi:Ribose-phosphate pyrophosphokinase 1 [Citrus sinensis]|uniref:Ribose-phosphate pyrophosphokinase 1 n=1 Tax=Citrus sinensis TaxID=2711 RepID=A0ACB8L8F5_CITSI|nr:Ribose-phosphate pyrophosphokinase 1 [Citrus sinensis]